MDQDRIEQLLKKGVERLDPRLQAFVGEYNATESSLYKVVVDALTSPDLKTTRQRRRFSGETRDALSQVDKVARRDVPELIDEAVSLGARTMVQEVEGPRIRGGQMQRAAASALSDALVGRLNDATSTVGRRVDDVFRREGLRAAASAQGGINPEVANATMVRRLSAEGITSFVDRSGRKWGLVQYARMAVNTTVQEAVNTGTQQVLLAMGVDLAKINSVDGPCVICKQWDGKVVSLTGATKGYKRMVRIPPLHPECRHFLLPAREAFAEQVAA